MGRSRVRTTNDEERQRIFDQKLCVMKKSQRGVATPVVHTQLVRDFTRAKPKRKTGKHIFFFFYAIKTYNTYSKRAKYETNRFPSRPST